MKTTPFQLVIIGLFALAAFAAVGVLSGIITLPQSAEESAAGKVVVWGTLDNDAFQFTENFLDLQIKIFLFNTYRNLR